MKSEAHRQNKEKTLLFYSPGELLCVSASVGQCRTQNNILFLSMPFVCTSLKIILSLAWQCCF